MDIFMLLFIIAGLVALVVGGELLVRGASQLAVALGIAPVIVGLTIVAFGTSVPELAVSVDAALAGNADIAIANVVGSNLFNTLLILGVSSLIIPLVIHSTMIRREVPVMITLSAGLMLMVLNGKLDQWEGFVLAAVAVGYTWWLVQGALKEKGKLREEMEQEFGTKPETTPTSILKLLGLVAVGLGIIMLGADWLVEGASSMARSLGVSDTVIGLTIVSIGTSLPEVVASIMAALKGERDIAVGNVIGSNIYNISGILGITALILPSGLNVDPAMLSFDIPFLVVVAMLCLPMFWVGRVLTRAKGAFFLAGYIAYAAFLVLRATG